MTENVSHLFIKHNFIVVTTIVKFVNNWIVSNLNNSALVKANNWKILQKI